MGKKRDDDMMSKKKAPPFTKDDEKKAKRAEVVHQTFADPLKDAAASSSGMPGTDCTAGNGQDRGGQGGVSQG